MKNGEEVLSSEKQPEIESCFVKNNSLFLYLSTGRTRLLSVRKLDNCLEIAQQMFCERWRERKMGIENKEIKHVWFVSSVLLLIWMSNMQTQINRTFFNSVMKGRKWIIEKHLCDGFCKNVNRKIGRKKVVNERF